MKFPPHFAVIAILATVALTAGYLVIQDTSTSGQAVAIRLSCTDSDGGKAYGIPGGVTLSAINLGTAPVASTSPVANKLADKCTSKTKLKETFCAKAAPGATVPLKPVVPLSSSSPGTPVTGTDAAFASEVIVCPSGGTCVEVNGIGACSCVPESDINICSRLNKRCGSVTANDNCGASRTVDCTLAKGSCLADQVCMDNACVCVPETNSATCARLNMTCGNITVGNNCGTNINTNCGACPAGKSCISHNCY